ncbi:OmpA family protein [Geoalkalibacter sp.]|uniref:OmpA family protein n=1 Tax=Geoalkalibacter sp. TaxID=3041440 RepID=UPI00272DF308|nr:OmpA family protein [Geoalkalibacter sp.]
MRKTTLTTLGLFLIAGLFAGCAGLKADKQPTEFTPANFAAGQYDAKVNNFQVILDASMTMGTPAQRDLQSAKNLASAINRSIPADLALNGGLRSFGHSDRQSPNLTDLVYGMTSHTQSGFQQGLDKIKYAGGNSPLGAALLAAGQDLAGTQGKSAIIVISDGLQMEDAPAAAKKIKAEMGDRLCIYTIAIGDSAAGRQLLEKVAQAGECGSATTDAALISQAGMASFVETVFLTPKAVAAPAPAPAVAIIDSDGDGVPDHLDQCPDTPRGVIVDERGCPIELKLHIEFDFDKADIRPRHKADIDRAAAFIRQYPQVPYILIAGHTDSIGTDAYNQKLSERRANAVRDALIKQHGIDAKRLVARGYGESQPIATNDTPEGRQHNRRVELICCVVIPQ